jgi:hypothetical protein
MRARVNANMTSVPRLDDCQRWVVAVRSAAADACIAGAGVHRRPVSMVQERVRRNLREIASVTDGREAQAHATCNRLDAYAACVHVPSRPPAPTA